MYTILIQKNNEFYIKNRYKINLCQNLDIFYKEEQKHIENKLIFSLKNANFINWLKNPEINEPYHKFKKGKKRISRQIKLKCWDREFNENNGTCPIKCCSVSISKNIQNWHAGHIISEYNGGDTILENLRPICEKCNLSMGYKNWIDYEL